VRSSFSSPLAFLFLNVLFGSRSPCCRRFFIDPVVISSLTNAIATRHLENNQLTGSLPKEWSAFQRLVWM
jgi:hypothetical protein